MKSLLLALGFAAVASIASAQVANISTTAASSFNSLNLTTSMQSAPVSPTAFSNDGATMFVIKTGATAVSATVRTQATQIQQAGYGTVALTDLTVAVPANTYSLLGPFPQGRWNTQQGTVIVSLTSITAVSVSAISQAQ